MMKKDFTIEVYLELLSELQKDGYAFQTFKEFLKKPNNKTIILRHDVDLLPKNSMNFAQIQAKKGIKGTYYFRAVPESWDENIILKIANLGHEIGYHYECLTTCNGDMKLAMQDFEKNLEKLRDLVSVSTICMHGSPMSKYDSKDLWIDHDYKNHDLIGEPYFDIDFDKVFYLTDTGRMWDGNKTSVRDKVRTKFKNSYHATSDLIDTLRVSKLPNQMMFTFHPQRWHSNNLLWTKELLLQNSKNIIKKHLYV